MYQNIYVPLDNSEHSDRVAEHALRLGVSYGAKLTGCHVYAARMHDYRFKQMEFTLPEEYLEEAELHRQRKIHDSLITMGLELISDCYLDPLAAQAAEHDVEFERRMMDGKHSTEIIKDIAASEDVDLVMIGALGLGRTKDSQIGSVCRRVTESVARDTWVVKHVPKKGDVERDTIMVGVDGSPQSFGALMTAIDLAKRFDKKIELVGVYDPYLHYAVFKGIVEVLSEKAAKIFRFEEQNQLHEEVIDTGLAEIYQSHLNVAQTMAENEGITVSKTLLDGKAFQKVLDHARKIEPWLLVIGRVGVHVEDEEDGLGSNTENLLRLAPCDVLLSTREVRPEVDLRAEESVLWTPEAESRMTRVPEQVKGIARTAILRLAIEQGHSVVTSDLVTEAMNRFMPKSTSAQTEKLAEALAIQAARDRAVSVCRECSTAAQEPDPVRCPVCGSVAFDVVTPEMLARIEAQEGGAEEETTYDGRKLRWTQESRKALKTLTDPYQRRRAKARIEKSARRQKLETVSLEHARRFIEEEAGVLYETAGATATEEPAEAITAGEPEESDRKLLARDGKNVPFLSSRHWEDDALVRILRVPAGFMRDRTQGRVEDLAAERGIDTVDLALVEEGIGLGMKMMEQMLAEQGLAPEPAPENGDQAGEKKASGCPFAAMEKNRLALNEAGLMQELDAKRRELSDS